jgi:hypothetical protein
MAITDGLLTLSSAQVITATAASTSVIDLTGAGSGNAPNMVPAGTTYGADMGVGDGMAIPKIVVSVGTVFATLTSLQIAAQFAPDSGSNTPGTYITYAQTGAIPVADLVAGAMLGTFNYPQMPTKLDGTLTDYPMPRWVRLDYIVGGSSATTGTINAYVELQRDSQLGGVNYPSGFVVAA